MFSIITASFTFDRVCEELRWLSHKTKVKLVEVRQEVRRIFLEGTDYNKFLLEGKFTVCFFYQKSIFIIIDACRNFQFGEQKT